MAEMDCITIGDNSQRDCRTLNEISKYRKRPWKADLQREFRSSRTIQVAKQNAHRISSNSDHFQQVASTSFSS
jgi:hypothetical protein